ncbi:MAG: hypothetical protein JNM57_05855 [Cyclobacteriaceae bacterium]|nr:hypothetical protein [Cyclobacteriaceae bacterium]
MFSTLIKYKFSKLKFAPLSLFIFSILITHASEAQVAQGNRLEFSLGELDTSFEVVNAEEKGIFLYRQFVLPDNSLELIYIDTAFQLKWRGAIRLEKNLSVVRTKFFNTSLYVLLRFRDYSRNDLFMLIIDADKSTYTIEEFRNYIPMQITTFDMTQRAALVGGYFNRIPIVLYLSLADKKSKVAPGLFTETGELTQVRTYDDGSFDVLVSARNLQRQQTVYIRNYDQEGTLVNKIPLEPERNKNFTFGRSIKTHNGNQVVAGTYGNRNSEYSKGIYIASIDPLGSQQIQYYSYGDLQNFFKYMKSRREQRVKNRIERRKAKGLKIRLNYRLMVHELVPYQNQFILLGEAFYPRYIYSDRSFFGGFYQYNYSYAPYSRIQNGRIFDGYNYTHAIVIGFNAKGKLLWDNSFEINDVKTFEMEQFVKLDDQQQQLAMIYLYNHQLRTKIIRDNNVLEGKTMEPIKLNSDTDFVRKGDTEKSKLEYWYEHNFYAYGVQKISNTRQNRSELKRKVFFINRIKIADP